MNGTSCFKDVLLYGCYYTDVLYYIILERAIIYTIQHYTINRIINCSNC